MSVFVVRVWNAHVCVFVHVCVISMFVRKKKKKKKNAGVQAGEGIAEVLQHQSLIQLYPS